MKRSALLTIFLFLLTFCHGADPQVIDLTQPNPAVPFTVNYASRYKLISQRYMSIQSVQAALPCYVGYCRSVYPGKLAMTDAEIMGNYEVTVAALQAIWYTSGASESPWCGTGTGDYNVNNSRAVIKFPSGAFPTKMPIMAASGELWGMGAGGWNDANYSTGGTTLIVDHVGWISRVFVERNLIQSENYLRGNEYLHGAKVHGFRLQGNSSLAPAGITSYGVAMLDLAEASSIYDIYAERFTTGGFLSWKGTPASMTNCSSFEHGKFGFSFLGASTTQLLLIKPSGDDNGEALIYQGPDKNGGVGGGTLVVIAPKYEIGTRTTSGGGLLKSRGSFNNTIIGASSQVFGGSTVIPYAFDVDSRHPDGWLYAASLTVSGFRMCGCEEKFGKLLKDHASTWTMPAYCDAISFSWNNRERIACTSYPITGANISGGGVPPAPTKQCVPVVVFESDSTSAPCPPTVVCPPCPAVCTSPKVCIDPCPPVVVCPPPVVCPPCPTCPPVVPCPPITGPVWNCTGWTPYNWMGYSTKTCTCSANCDGLVKKVETRRRP